MEQSLSVGKIRKSTADLECESDRCLCTIGDAKGADLLSEFGFAQGILNLVRTATDPLETDFDNISILEPQSWALT